MAHLGATAFDATIASDDPTWGKPQFASHTWVEPVIVLTIMFLSLVLNRRKDYSIRRTSHRRSGLLETDPDSVNRLLPEGSYEAADEQSLSKDAGPSRKKRSCCGLVIHTPNTSRFSKHVHSRILQKLPFLIEMFYWIINYLFYVATKPMTTKMMLVQDDVWASAQAHGVAVLQVEHSTWMRFLFPVHEVAFQQWFVGKHIGLLTFLNRAYSLVHIPGTVACIGWYYYAAPSHSHFAIFRRSMTLLNFIAFAVFTVWPCMPPRLLPEKYGFVDTVHRDNGESVWAKGNYVNQLAAMPSLHFGYSLAIGVVLIYHSGAFRRTSRGEPVMSLFWKILYIFGGVGYPVFLLTVIVATANHYYLDALIATFVLLFAFLCNRVFLNFLPLEDLLLWALRLEKPVPTTGERLRKLPVSKHG